MLQDSDEEKLYKEEKQIFMILFEKKVAKPLANDFEDSQDLWDLCRTLCNSRHSFLELWLLSEISFL